MNAPCYETEIRFQFKKSRAFVAMLVAVVCNQLVQKHIFREPDAEDEQMYHNDADKQLENKHSESCGFEKQNSMQEVIFVSGHHSTSEIARKRV